MKKGIRFKLSKFFGPYHRTTRRIPCDVWHSEGWRSSSSNGLDILDFVGELQRERVYWNYRPINSCEPTFTGRCSWICRREHVQFTVGNPSRNEKTSGNLRSCKSSSGEIEERSDRLTQEDGWDYSRSSVSWHQPSEVERQVIRHSVSRQLPPSTNFFIEPFVHSCTDLTMAQQRLALWNAEEDLEDEVDLSIAIGNYGPNVQYEDGECMNHWNYFCLSSHSSCTLSAHFTTSDWRVDSDSDATTYGTASSILSNSWCR